MKVNIYGDITIRKFLILKPSKITKNGIKKGR